MKLKLHYPVFLLFFLYAGCTGSKLPATLPKGNDIIDSKNYIIWGQSALSWNDFKGKKLSDKFDAGTFGGISFSKKENEHWKCFAYFDKTLSWHRGISAIGLIHENYHFNIVEIFARQIRKAITEKHFSMDSTLQMNTYVNNVWVDVERMQNQYDTETDYSRNDEQQKKWQHYIDSTINSLNVYKSIILE